MYSNSTACRDYITSMTQEQRLEALVKAKAARAANLKFAEDNKHKYKLDYLDEMYWANLATANGIRMPSKISPANPKVINKYIRKTGVGIDKFKEHYTSVKYFLENNPTWTEYAVAGLILELAYE